MKTSKKLELSKESSDTIRTMNEDTIIKQLKKDIDKAVNNLAKVYLKNGDCEDIDEAKDCAEEYLSELMFNGDI